MNLLQAMLVCDAALAGAVAGRRLRGAPSAPPAPWSMAQRWRCASTLTVAAAAPRCSVAPRRLGLTLPIGLPWIGANFRSTRCRRSSPSIVNLGGAAASLYGLGYGRHEREPGRVLPFFPAFLAGMNLVLVADDAYIVPAVVGVHVAGVVGAGDGAPSRGRRSRGPASSTSSWRASARCRCCSSFGLLAGAGGGYAFDGDARRAARAPASPRWRSPWRSSAPGRRPASRRCTSGCRSPIPPRRATSRR